jgi:hypothetical protein
MTPLALVPVLTLFAFMSGCATDGVSPTGQGTAVSAGLVAAGTGQGKLGEVFTLRVGESASLREAGLSLRFERVTEDSRCPVGVTCVWEGDAVVRVVVSAGGKDATLDLHTQANFARELVHEGYRVRLVKLEPLPQADRPTDPRAYVASFLVEKTA